MFRSLKINRGALGLSRCYSTQLTGGERIKFDIQASLPSMNNSACLQPVSKYADISLQTRLHYLEYSSVGCMNSVIPSDFPRSTKTLVAVHGSYQTAFTFDDLIQEMHNLCPIQPFRVISVDLRGHGNSSWSPDGNYSLQILRDDIAKFIDTLGIEDYYLLGNGLGSLVSLDLGASEVLRNNLLGIIPIEVPSSPKKLQAHDSLRYNASFSSFEKFVNFCMGLNPNTTESSMRKRLQMAIREDTTSGKWSWRRDPRFNFDSDIFQSEIELLISKITGLASQTRILVVRGEHSQVSSQRSTEKLLKTLNEGVESERNKSRAVTLPGGHLLHGDAPKQLARHVLHVMDLM